MEASKNIDVFAEYTDIRRNLLEKIFLLIGYYLHIGFISAEYVINHDFPKRKYKTNY